MPRWTIGAARDLPLSNDSTWDGSAAQRSLFGAGEEIDQAAAKAGHLVYDAEAPELKGSYKLPFALRRNGRLVASIAGLRAAASRLPQTDIPADVQNRARAVLDAYRKKAMQSQQRVRVHQRVLVQLTGNGIKVRGKRIYAPAVIIKPGVLNGVLVDEHALRDSELLWAGRPVTINHPPRGVAAADEQTWLSHVAGVLLNVRYDGGLKGTMVLDQAAMGEVGKPAKRVYQALRAGQTFEVSTGYWAEIDYTASGTHKGTPYMGVTRGIYPDHVAILPDVEGACSWGDGCGMPRVNSAECNCVCAEQQEVGMNEETRQLEASQAEAVPATEPDAVLAESVALTAGTSPESISDVTVANQDDALADEAGDWVAWEAWDADEAPGPEGAPQAGDAESSSGAEAPASNSAEGSSGVQAPEAETADATLEEIQPVANQATPEDNPPAQTLVSNEDASLLAAIRQLGGIEAITAAVQTMVEQRAQQRQQHIAAIVANGRGHLSVADVDGLPDATLERMARALTPQSYAGAARPAQPAADVEWVEYSVPEVPERK